MDSFSDPASQANFNALDSRLAGLDAEIRALQEERRRISRHCGKV